MDSDIRARIVAEYPDALDQAWRRIFAGRTIFYDTRTHRRLPKYTDSQILACLILANAMAADWRDCLDLSIEEKRLWRRHFIGRATDGR